MPELFQRLHRLFYLYSYLYSYPLSFQSCHSTPLTHIKTTSIHEELFHSELDHHSLLAHFGFSINDLLFP